MMSGVRASSIRIEFDLVHDAEVVAALGAVLEPDRHVVAEVVEAELGVRAVGGVRGIRLAALGLGHHRRDHADRRPEELVERPHPLGVAAGQVVVDRDQVHAAPGEPVEVHRRDGREGLALAGLHLGDAAEVERHRADHLDVEQAHPQDPATRLADGREGVGQDVVERLALGQPRLELSRPGAELVVAERLHGGLEVVDPRDLPLHALQDPALADAQDLVDEIGAHGHARGIGVTAIGNPSAGVLSARRSPNRRPGAATAAAGAMMRPAWAT